MMYQGSSIQCSQLEDGIVELCFNAEGSVNKFDAATLMELQAAIQILHEAQDLQAVLVTSTKKTFIVGADVTEFLSKFSMPKESLDRWLRDCNLMFNEFEDLPVPTLAAINGAAFGGGMEMCLACDFRLASTHASVGLPETKLGLIPGWGGTTRLPRLIGADNAIEWIAGGAPSKAEAALKVGAVDAVVAPDKLHEAGLKMLRSAVSGKLDWKTRRLRKQSPLMLVPVDAKMVFETSRAFIFSKAGTNYPAPFKAVDVIEQSAGLSRDEALEIERAAFIEVAYTPVAESLVTLFLNDQQLKRQAKAAAKTADAVEKMAVLGAGIMGGGIAYQAAGKKIAVVMKDIRSEALDQGMGEVSKLLGKQIKRGKIDMTGMAQVLSRITPTLHYAEVGDTQLVVEAVVENPKIKAAVLKETEALLADDAILTSNTSTISIDLLAKDLQRPDQFCGMHFFNPVHLMPLVEIIRGEKTSDATVASVVALASAMGKSPIVVNDCPGFLVNRVLFPYFRGFNLLVKDGADFRDIDKVMEGFGWPMGPAYLLDVVGLDTGHHAAAVMADGFPDRMANDFDSALDALYAEARYGQKNDAGFYRYELDRKGKQKKIFDESVLEILKPVCAEPTKFDQQEIIDRMMLPMVIELIRCLEDNIVTTVAEADMGLIYGIGFPPFRGGALKYADHFGMKNLISSAEKYQHLGKAYEPTEGMRKMAESGETFYPRPDQAGGGS